LGDILHVVPTVHQLAEQYDTDIDIDWVTQPEYCELVSCVEGIRRAIPYPRKNLRRGLGEFRRTLREETYEAAFDLQGLFKSAFAMRHAKAQRRVGPSNPREGSRFLYHEHAAVAANQPSIRHAVDRGLDLISHLQLKPKPATWDLQFPPYAIEKASQNIALLPCSRWYAKNWPAASFIALARRLLDTPNRNLFFIGSPADETICEEIRKELGSERVFNLCGKTSIPQLGSVLEEMDLLITNDSGPMHLSVAVGTPTIALFGPTDPRKCGPYGDNHAVIQGQAVGGGYKGEDNFTIASISVDEVFEKAEAKIASLA